MPRGFDWNDLRFFLAVAQVGTLTGAARRLGTDHATVSRRISALEASIGAKLFERTPQGYLLTLSGERLIAHAEAMEAEAIAATEGLGRPEAGITGTLRINTLEGFGTFFMAPRLGRFAAMHPRLKVELVTIQQIVALSRREGDVAITLSPPKEGRFVTHRITDYRLGLYAAPAYLARHPPIVRRADLETHAFVGYVDDLVFTRGLDYLDEVSPRLKARLQSSSLVAQRTITEQGHGICVLPHFMARGRPGLTPVLPDEVELTRSYWLFTHRDVAESARVRAFVRFVGEEVAAAAAWFAGAAAQSSPGAQSEQ
jgi:DNA-binding transcriptional LysR family regulator